MPYRILHFTGFSNVDITVGRPVSACAVCDKHYENGKVTPIVGVHGAGSLQVWQSKF
jgi:hypothetical protein